MKRIRVKQLVTFEGEEQAVLEALYETGTTLFCDSSSRTIETTGAEELLPYDLNKKP